MVYDLHAYVISFYCEFMYDCGYVSIRILFRLGCYSIVQNVPQSKTNKQKASLMKFNWYAKYFNKYVVNTYS